MNQSFYLELYALSKDVFVLSNDTTTVEVIAPNGTPRTRHNGFAYGVYFSVLVNGQEVKQFKQLGSLEKFLVKLISDFKLTTSVVKCEDGKNRWANKLN